MMKLICIKTPKQHFKLNSRKKLSNTGRKKKEIIAKIMNNYFKNITVYLKLKPIKINSKANLERIGNTFQNYERVQRIKLGNFHSKSSL